MTFPSFVQTREASIGTASLLISADPLVIQVTITPSRGLVWDATGDRFESSTLVTEGNLGESITLDLPCTDVAGWRDSATGALIDVSAPDSYTHTYTAVVRFLDAGKHSTGRAVTLGPFVLPAGDGSPVDLDKLLPVPGVAGGSVLVPDSWSALVADAVAAVSDYLTTAAAPELIRDTMGTALVAGANITITPNDPGDTITIAASGGGGGGVTGTGFPEGVVTAPPGTQYIDTAGTNGAWVWTKTSGVGNTGWTVTVGDTGWRSDPSVGVGFQATPGVWYRRTNSAVQLRARGTLKGGGYNFLLISFPVGFRPTAWNPPQIQVVQSNVSWGWYILSADFTVRAVSASAAGQTWDIILNETTSDPWPTSLPGTAA